MNRRFTMSHRRCVPLAVGLFISLLVLLANEARASSFSTSTITSNNTVSDDGDTSSSVTQGNNSASSFVLPVNELVGASVRSDGTAFSVSTSSSHTDDWFCSGSCAAVSGPLDLSLAIGFDAVLSPHIGEFQLNAQYTIGGANDVISISAGADSSDYFAAASFDGDPIDAAFVPAPDGSGNLLLVVTMTRHFICPCYANNAPFFSDSVGIQLEMEGAGFIDASHTFSVSWTPTDPNLQFTSTDGRIAGSGPSAAPVPEPGSLLLLGTGLVYATRTCRRRRPARRAES